MMGRPGQKCRTSEIHYWRIFVSICTVCMWDRASYLLLDIVKRVWGVDGEADEDDMGIRIRQRTKAIVVFLARGIPQG